jgi:hypothetical protein
MYDSSISCPSFHFLRLAEALLHTLESKLVYSAALSLAKRNIRNAFMNGLGRDLGGYFIELHSTDVLRAYEIWKFAAGGGRILIVKHKLDVLFHTSEPERQSSVRESLVA